MLNFILISYFSSSYNRDNINNIFTICLFIILKSHDLLSYYLYNIEILKITPIIIKLLKHRSFNN